jgi:hypothetical protein
MSGFVHISDAGWQERLDALLARHVMEKSVPEFEDLVTENSEITTWEDFEGWFEPFKDDGWFRGQPNAIWHLQTKAERGTWADWSVDSGARHYDFVENVMPEDNEETLLREFQREAHNYHVRTPASDDIVDWLALMQHYGAPTRMLDWSRSPYVALYFAMRSHPTESATLWAIDMKWLKERSIELLHKHGEDCPEDPSAFSGYINRILLNRENSRIIVPASPRELNDRMRIQQGELLCNLRHGFAFSTILLGMMLNPSRVQRQVVSRIVVKKDKSSEFLEKLRRMKIDEANLFPGTDPFAESLTAKLEELVQCQVEESKQALLDRHRAHR